MNNLDEFLVGKESDPVRVRMLAEMSKRIQERMPEELKRLQEEVDRPIVEILVPLLLQLEPQLLQEKLAVFSLTFNRPTMRAVRRRLKAAGKLAAAA